MMLWCFTTFIAQYPIVALFYLFVLMLCLAGVCWIDIPSSLFFFSDMKKRWNNRQNHVLLLSCQTSHFHFSFEMYTRLKISYSGFFLAVLFFVDEVVLYLLEYVCSRGPLSPHFLTALLHFYPFYDLHFDVASSWCPPSVWLAPLATLDDLLALKSWSRTP